MNWLICGCRGFYKRQPQDVRLNLWYMEYLLFFIPVKVSKQTMFSFFISIPGLLRFLRLLRYKNNCNHSSTYFGSFFSKIVHHNLLYEIVLNWILSNPTEYTNGYTNIFVEIVMRKHQCNKWSLKKRWDGFKRRNKKRQRIIPIQ